MTDRSLNAGAIRSQLMVAGLDYSRNAILDDPARNRLRLMGDPRLLTRNESGNSMQTPQRQHSGNDRNH